MKRFSMLKGKVSILVQVWLSTDVCGEVLCVYLVKIESEMPWRGGVACSVVTDGGASCVTCGGWADSPASDELPASTGNLPVSDLRGTAIPTADRRSPSLAFLRYRNTGNSVLPA